jgi:hypothetical protein
LKLNGTHQLLVYADDVNILGGILPSIKENREALAVTRKGSSLEVNAENSEYMVMSRDQNAGHNHNIKNYNESFERVKQFKYFFSWNVTNSLQHNIPLQCATICLAT